MQTHNLPDSGKGPHRYDLVTGLISLRRPLGRMLDRIRRIFHFAAPVSDITPTPPSRPLVKVALGYLCGLAAARLFPIPIMPVWIALLVLPALIWGGLHSRLLRRNSSRILMFALLAALAGILRVEYLELRWSEQDRFMLELSRSGPHELIGCVSDVGSDSQGRTRIRIGSVELQYQNVMKSIPGTIEFHPEPFSELCMLQPGDWFSASVRFMPVRSAAFPGGFDARTHFYAEGLAGRAYEIGEGKKLSNISSTTHRFSWWTWWRCRSFEAERLVRSRFSPEVADLLVTLTLGRRGLLEPGIREAFVNSGLMHLTAISGLHTALWLGGVLFLLRAIGFRRRWVAWLTPLLLLAFVALVGPRIPTIRAAIMAGILAGSILLSRPSDSLNALAAALLALLLVQPAQAWGVSFQLSFLVVAALILMMPRWHGQSVGFAAQCWRWLVISIEVSALATVVTCPLLLYHFGRCAPVAVIANLAAIPVTMALLFSAYIWLLLSLCGIAWIAEPFASTAGFLTRTLISIADVSSSLPYAHFEVGHFAPPVFIALLGSMAVLAIRKDCLNPGGHLKAPRSALVLGLFAFAAVSNAAWGYLRPAYADFLCLGQGDATLLRSRQGTVVLVDGGAPPNPESPYEPGLVQYLRSQDIEQIDLIVLTHPEEDHIGAIPEVMSSFKVRMVVTPGVSKPTAAYQHFLQSAQVNEVPIQILARGDRIEGLPGFDVEAIHPPPHDRQICVEATTSVNGLSVVLLVQMEGSRFLLTGDIDGETEKGLVRHDLLGDVNILKVPHHGSRTSTSWELLDLARPELAVIELGRNSYGHPHPETLNRLTGAGTHIMRTDRDGTVRIHLRHGKPAIVWGSRTRNVCTLYE